jgi:hypothetical protein
MRIIFPSLSGTRIPDLSNVLFAETPVLRAAGAVDKTPSMTVGY